MADGEKAAQLDCSGCTPGLQALRNCSGNGSRAMVELNGAIHTRCPRAIYLESNSQQALVNIYFECRENKTYPVPGGPMAQTHFTLVLFDYLDNLVAQSRARKAKESDK